MKILLFGKNGKLGGELHRSLRTLGEVVAVARESQDLCGDLNNLEGIAKTIRDTSPDVIVNTAAYTAVDKAESEPDLAYLINADAPKVMAQETAKSGALLVHYSTDYVFSGSGERPWTELDAPAPLNVYGHTKLAGERAIQASGSRYLIFRTSWVYAASGKSFPKTILNLAVQRDSLKVVSDQIGAPTGADLLANVTAKVLPMVMLRPEAEGLYHLAARGEVSWYDYARFVLESARGSGIVLKTTPEAIIPVSSSDYPMPAKRPLNSRLDSSRLQQTFGLELPEWQEGVRVALAKMFPA